VTLTVVSLPNQNGPWNPTSQMYTNSREAFKKLWVKASHDDEHKNCIFQKLNLQQQLEFMVTLPSTEWIQLMAILPAEQQRAVFDAEILSNKEKIEIGQCSSQPTAPSKWFEL